VLRPLLLTLLALLAIVLLVNSSVFDPGDDTSGTVKSEVAKPHSRAAAKTNSKPKIAPKLALGQMIVARFTGQDPPAAFLARIEAGEIGGVILFEENLGGGEIAIGHRVQQLEDAARNGGQPPLLIMVDQEGGEVKRIPGAPHTSAAAMADADQAREEGEATGQLLERLGIDVDLAPVADVGHPGSFLDSRTFASSPEEVASLACEFASGLHREGIAATLKHFPGLGLATTNTDEAMVTVNASAEEIRADYAPYQACADEPPTLVMVNSAIYPALSGNQPAVMSPLIYESELPRAGAHGVTISDDLETPAIQAQTAPARRSINAGLDLLLYARSESTSAEAYARLLEDLHTNSLSSREVESAASKILALKGQLEH
jgi:beta-N-acetylhexosaminidase